MEMFPLEASNLSQEPPCVFALPLHKEIDPGGVPEAEIELEQAFSSAIKKSWIQHTELANKMKRLSMNAKVGIYLGPEYPNSLDSLFYICGDRKAKKQDRSLEKQIGKICSKFFIEKDYFTSMMPNPNTFYLIEGEVSRKTFADEMVSLAGIINGKPRLKVAENVAIPDGAVKKIESHFELEPLSKEERDKFVKDIGKKILERDFPPTA